MHAWKGRIARLLVEWLRHCRERISECPPEPACPPDARIADSITPRALVPLLSAGLAGTPAREQDDGDADDAGAVVWVDHGDEVIVHLDSIETRLESSVLLVAVDLETDETGRQTLVVPFAIGENADDELTVVTEELPRGNAALAARWGHVLQDALFASLVEMAEIHAEERQTVAKALVVEGSALAFVAEKKS